MSEATDLDKIALLDSSSVTEDEGPYVADVYEYHHNECVAEYSTGYVLFCRMNKGNHNSLGPVANFYQNEKRFVKVPRCDVVEVMSVAEARYRLLVLKELMERGEKL